MQSFSILQFPVKSHLNTVDDSQACPRIKERRSLAKRLDHALDAGAIRHGQGEVTFRVLNSRCEHAMDGHTDAHGAYRSRVVIPVISLSRAAGKG